MLSSLPSNQSYVPMDSDQIWTVTEDLGMGHTFFHSVIACRDGGYVATGMGYFEGRRSILLMRFGENGEVIWRRFFQGYFSQAGREVVECRSGGFAIIGYITSNNHDVLLLRTDEEGQPMWHQTYGGVTSFEQGLALVECSNNDFAFAGVNREFSSEDSDYLLVRTNWQGTMLWNNTYGGSAPDICYSLVEAGDGFLTLGGSSESYGAGEEDAWIVRTNSGGTQVWDSTFGGPGSDVGYDIIEAERGLDPLVTFVGSTENTANMISDSFITSIRRDGPVGWETTFGCVLFDIGYGGTKCQDGGYAITGCTVDGSDGSTNLLLVRLNGHCEYQWSKSYGTEHNDEGYSIVQAANGDFIVVGLSDGYLDSQLYTQSMAYAIRVPDIEPGVISQPEYGPPDFGLIGAGGGLAILTLLGASLILLRSRREIRQSWSEPKRRVIEKSFLTPHLLDELSPILRGSIQCMKCNERNPKSNLRCNKCTSHLHFCMFCGQVIGKDDQVIFCPKCKILAHSNHMLEWLTKRNYCPSCSRLFRRRKRFNGNNHPV